MKDLRYGDGTFSFHGGNGSTILTNRRLASGVAFPHPAGRFRPGGFCFSSPGCWNCVCMEGFQIRKWVSVARAYVRFFSSPGQSATGRLVGVCHTIRDGVDSGGTGFPNLSLSVEHVGSGFPHVWGGIDSGYCLSSLTCWIGVSINEGVHIRDLNREATPTNQ